MPDPTEDKRRQKETLYQLFARISKALANPHRLELVDSLTQASRTVEDLAQVAHMSIANTSQHLQRLKQARLVIDEREGVYIRYRLADDAVARLWQELRAVTEQQMAEVRDALDAYRDRRYEFERISIAELRQRLQTGDVLLLDVRPEVEYAAGHIPGSLSLPLAELAQHLDRLQPDLPVVAYCRGAYCVLADEALALLSANGRSVARLEEGVWEWQQAGYVVGHGQN